MSVYDDCADNYDWLQEQSNREKYQGQWVVIKHGELIAYGSCYKDLYRQYGNCVNTGTWIVRVKR
jgi:hypothetical protein